MNVYIRLSWHICALNKRIRFKLKTKNKIDRKLSKRNISIPAMTDNMLLLLLLKILINGKLLNLVNKRMVRNFTVVID